MRRSAAVLILLAFVLTGCAGNDQASWQEAKSVFRSAGIELEPAPTERGPTLLRSPAAHYAGLTVAVYEDDLAATKAAAPGSLHVQNVVATFPRNAPYRQQVEAAIALLRAGG